MIALPLNEPFGLDGSLAGCSKTDATERGARLFLEVRSPSGVQRGGAIGTIKWTADEAVEFEADFGPLPIEGNHELAITLFPARTELARIPVVVRK